MWIAGVIIFFSLGKGKLATYILPVMPAAALYLAREWQRWSEPGAKDPDAERLSGLEWGAGLALFAPIVIVAFVAMRWDPVHASSFLGYAAPFGLMSGGSIGAALLLSRRTRRWVVVPALTACVSAFYLFLIAASGGELEHGRSLKSMVLETRLEQRPEVRLCVYRDFRPSLVFYARRHVERADNLGELQAFLRQPGEEVVVMDTDRLEGLGERLLTVLRKIAVQGRQVALAKRPDATAEMIEAIPPPRALRPRLHMTPRQDRPTPGARHS